MATSNTGLTVLRNPLPSVGGQPGGSILTVEKVMSVPQTITSSTTTRRDQRRRRAVLVALLRDRFTVDELKRAVREHPDGPDVLGEVPEVAKPNDVYEEVVAAFDRRGIDQELFEILVERRPRKLNEIGDVALMFGIRIKLPN